MNKIIYDIFNHNPIIPVVKINDQTKVMEMIQALKDGGINIIEVTMRTDNALEIINTIAKNHSDILVGAGTILNTTQYQMAIDNGAKFIISPGSTFKLLEFASRYNDIAYIPGAITPTEIMMASEYELKYLKYFPAEANNGISNLKNFASVFPHIKFCPTGGITLDNYQQYLSLPNVVAIGTSLIVTDEYLKQNNYSEITKIATKFSSTCAK